ncbi:1-acyl-sn-glycerol-3-phosphate acyltransferase [Pedobacter flavus]|uniref:1-acyl-sn-glycerol-3-phosphate acyltransferase n=1 Tax=Pedobacter flavus TaxID=3113906 RepID=A0ABU7H2M3_9SPHI|nr:1-acyl-sn-glycerol-3-phosphate acyltransferase [Pedobacter sp. VNH31]MEE1885317.1 1-acyl-sn-glycerol-3-phosphate acyltransferase [Pedobacter sp. VNH31]
MIIKPKLLPLPIIKLIYSVVSWYLNRRFNKLTIHPIKLNTNHSYLLMCNHFSFLDGMLAFHLCRKSGLMNADFKGLYFMILKKQMQMKPWLKYLGGFSVDPGKGTIGRSLNYASEILSTPGNVLLMFPQGNLESIHVRNIEIKEGINTIVPNINGNCQIIWCSTIIEFFESLQPSAHFNLLDCGTNKEFDFEKISQNINSFHKEALKKNIRFTKE